MQLFPWRFLGDICHSRYKLTFRGQRHTMGKICSKGLTPGNRRPILWEPSPHTMGCSPPRQDSLVVRVSPSDISIVVTVFASDIFMEIFTLNLKLETRKAVTRNALLFTENILHSMDLDSFYGYIIVAT